MSVLEASELRLAAAAAVSTICVASAWRERHDTELRRAWLTFALVMGLIALGHSLHAGRGAAESGRAAFRLEGLYESRRPFQLAVVGLLLIGSVVGTIRLAGWLREPWRRPLRLPALALWLLVGFLLVRTVSYHEIDRLLYTHHPLGAHPGLLIELGGIILVGLLVLRAQASPRRQVTLVPVFRVAEPPPLLRRRLGRFRPQRTADRSGAYSSDG